MIHLRDALKMLTAQQLERLEQTLSMGQEGWEAVGTYMVAVNANAHTMIVNNYVVIEKVNYWYLLQDGPPDDRPLLEKLIELRDWYTDRPTRVPVEGDDTYFDGPPSINKTLPERKDD